MSTHDYLHFLCGKMACLLLSNSTSSHLSCQAWRICGKVVGSLTSPFSFELHFGSGRKLARMPANQHWSAAELWLHDVSPLSASIHIQLIICKTPKEQAKPCMSRRNTCLVTSTSSSSFYRELLSNTLSSISLMNFNV